MANQIQELRYQVGEAWKGAYNAATVYGNAAVVQDTAGLSVYRSLKPGNVGHPLNDAEWWFCIIDMSSIKALADSLQTLDGDISVHEAERVAAEAERVAAEASRVSAELARVAAEQQRASAESGRQEAEQTRVNQENARVAAEVARVAAEQARVAAEQARVLAENARVASETQRQLNEENRVAAEAERIEQAAEDHTQAESDHTTAASDHEAMAELVERADADHTAIESALATASDDHTQAVSDHTQAASDHTTAASDHTTAAADHTRAESDHTASEAATASALAAAQAAQEALANIESALAQKANIDGYYTGLTAGMAENLVGQSENTDTFTTETTGGDSDFGNGLAELAKIEGNGLAWNQQSTDPTGIDTTKWTNRQTSLVDGHVHFVLPDDSWGEVYQTGLNNKIVIGHKYYVKGETLQTSGDGRIMLFAPMNGVQVIGDGGHILHKGYGEAVQQYCLFQKNSSSNTGVEFSILGLEVTDVSIIYGLGNEPTSVEVVEADLAKLIAQKPYYQYNTGELYGVKKLHIVSYGQNLLNPTNAQARLAPYDWDTNSNKYGIAFRNGASASAIQFTPDATGVAESITPDSNGIFTISGAGTLQLTMASGSAASDCYVWAVWDGKKDGIDNYKPYSADALEIVVGNIYGKLNGAGDMVKVFSDDVMRATPTDKDIIDLESYSADVNVGKYTWTGREQWHNEYNTLWVKVTDFCKAAERSLVRSIVANRIPSGINQRSVGTASQGVMNYNYSGDYMSAGLSNEYATGYDFEAYLAQLYANGTPLEHFYPLATPAHYTDLQISTDGGATFQDLPERFSVDNWGVWEQMPNDATIPSGKDFTGVAAQITTILPMNAPEAIDTFLQQGITTAENRAQVVNILAALKAQNIIGDYSVGETPTDKVFSVSVTPYVEPEPEQEP